MMPPLPSVFQPPAWPGLRKLTFQQRMLLAREGVRWWLAVGLGAATLAVLGAILGTCLAGVISESEAKDLAAIFLAPLLTLTVAMFGFYYGGKQ